MSNTTQTIRTSVLEPNTTQMETVNEWADTCDDLITKVMYSITDDDSVSDNSTIPSYLVDGLNLELDTDSDDDNSTIASDLVGGLELGLDSDEDEDEDEDQLPPVMYIQNQN